MPEVTLTLLELRILNYMLDGKVWRSCTIANKLAIERAGVCMYMSRLLKKGFIKRVPGETYRTRGRYQCVLGCREAVKKALSNSQEFKVFRELGGFVDLQEGKEKHTVSGKVTLNGDVKFVITLD